MENDLKAALGLSFLKFKGSRSGGCINEGNVFETNKGEIFVKINSDPEATLMFEGEMEGLKVLQNTNTVRVPKPMQVVNLANISSTGLVMEYLDLKGLSNFAEELGYKLAQLHLFNSNLQKSDNSVHKSREDKTENLEFVDKFGFHCTTCCGKLPQENAWRDNWVEFYAQQRLDYQLKMIENNYKDKEVRELWSELSLTLSNLFKGIEVKPAILHGDLWSGNVSGINEGPVIFDPAVFYGHAEYELAIADMFGGFPRSFYHAYHKVLPKQPNFEKRQDLYKLFHCLNHWNHFGNGYRSSSVSIMKRLLKDL